MTILVLSRRLVAGSKANYRFYSQASSVIQQVGPEDHGRLRIMTPNFGCGGDAAVIASYNDTSVLCSVTINKNEPRNKGLLPLTVNFNERTSAAGQIPWQNFVTRREKFVIDSSTLIARAVDRSIRPSFPKGFFYDTEVTIQLLSFDFKTDLTTLSINAASSALSLCNKLFSTTHFEEEHPLFKSPVAAVRLLQIEDNLLVNVSDFVIKDLVAMGISPKVDLLVSGLGGKKLVMLEAKADEANNETLKKLVQSARSHIEESISSQRELIQSTNIGNEANSKDHQISQRKTFNLIRPSSLLASFSHNLFYGKAVECIVNPSATRKERAAVQSKFYELAQKSLDSVFKKYSCATDDATAIPNEDVAFLEELGDDYLSSKSVEATFQKAISDCAFSKVNLDLQQRSNENLESLETLLQDNHVTFTERVIEIAKAVVERKEDSISRKFYRPDGRARDEVRKVQMDIGLLPGTHGSALFSRGESQVLATTTVASEKDGRICPSEIYKSTLKDGFHRENQKQFFVDYDFPSFAVNRAGPTTVNRRAVGHGNLAEKALLPLFSDTSLSTEESAQTPLLVMRTENNVLASDGSTSMASVAASSLSLFDTRSNFKSKGEDPPLAAGLSVGLHVSPDFEDSAHELENEVSPLSKPKNRKFKVLQPKILEKPPNNSFITLTDILGMEDHFGKMDFKVAGTKNGITALQLDIKTQFITVGILSQALEDAEKGRIQIIEKMEKSIKGVRKNKVPGFQISYEEITSEVTKVGALIGKNGNTIKQIEMDSDAKIIIVDNLAKTAPMVFIFADTQEKRDVCRNLIAETQKR